MYIFTGRYNKMEAIYSIDVFLRNLNKPSLLFSSLNKKKPDAAKKKGTANRDSILVRKKSALSLIDNSGEV